jgi:hypothetical protein
MNRPYEYALWVLSAALVAGSISGLVLVPEAAPTASSTVTCDAATGACSQGTTVLWGHIVGLLAPISFGIGLLGILVGLILRTLSPRRVGQEFASPQRRVDAEAFDQTAFMPPSDRASRREGDAPSRVPKISRSPR